MAANLVVRVTGDPSSYAPAVQRIIRQVDPDQPTRLVRSMNEIISLSVGDRRQHTALLVMFGGLAMLIAALGLYGLLAQTVSARGREIGIRMALGATWKSVMAMVMSRGMALTATGLAAGAAIAWSVTRAMSALLYGVDAGDPLTFAAVARSARRCRGRGVCHSGGPRRASLIRCSFCAINSAWICNSKARAPL